MGKRPVQPELLQYVFDASSLINIERTRKMSLIRNASGAVLIPEKVAGEVNQPGTPLSRFILAYPEVVTPFLSVQEEHQYLRVRRQSGIHDGEASAIAIALSRKKPLVIDEKETRATGKAREHGIEALTSQEFVKRQG